MITSNESKIYSPETIGMKKIKPEDIKGGSNVEESVKIFTNILDGKGSVSQNSVVIANASFAMKCYHPEKSLDDCKELSRESLLNGKAKKTLMKLLAMQ